MFNNHTQRIIAHGQAVKQNQDNATAIVPNMIGRIVRDGTSPSEDISELLTLSQILDKDKWNQILPGEDVLVKYVKQYLYSSNYKTSYASNVITGFTSLLFLAAVIGLFNRFVFFVSDPDLNKNEHTAESIRIFTDVLGYFLAPFILTITNALVNQYNLVKTKREADQRLKLILSDYKIFRDKQIKEYELQKEFFTLSEQLYQMKISSYSYLYNYEISRIRSLLSSEKFRPIFCGIKQSIIDSAHDIKYKSLSQTNTYTFSPDYISNILQDPGTINIIIDVIAEISSEKRMRISGKLIKKIPLTQNAHILQGVNKALEEYWNDPNGGLSLPDYTFDINYTKLGEYINATIAEQYPTLIFRHSLPRPLDYAFALPSSRDLAYQRPESQSGDIRP